MLKQNTSNRQQPVALVMAGGTGGHIFPGLAVAKELESKGWRVHWLGSQGGMEETLVAKHNIPLSVIAVSGLRGNGALGWFKAPFSLFKAMYQARKIIAKVNPQVVLGFGGFASGPGGAMAKVMGTYLIIHEQNAIAGMTNKLLSKWADVIFQAFPNTFQASINAETIGNPIRKEILELVTETQPEQAQVQSNSQPSDGSIESDSSTASDNKKTINVLVVGGSRGALALNQELPNLFADLVRESKIRVRHQAGEAGYQIACQQYEELDLISTGLIKVEAFIDDMAKAYQQADVVICRAGALTVSEIAAVGVAAVFVPYPFAVDDHQTLNANWLVAQQAGLVIAQSDLSKQATKKVLHTLLTDYRQIKAMAKNARKSAFLTATQKMAEASEKVLERAA